MSITMQTLTSWERLGRSRERSRIRLKRNYNKEQVIILYIPWYYQKTILDETLLVEDMATVNH